MSENRELHSEAVLSEVRKLLGEHYSSEFWEELVGKKGPKEVEELMERLKGELVKAQSDEGKEIIRRAWSSFKY